MMDRNQMGPEVSIGGKVYPWWETKGKPHANVFNNVHFLDETQHYKRDAYQHWLRLYSNRSLAVLSGAGYGYAIESGDKIRINVTKSAVDTITAMVGCTRPSPMYLPARGNYTLLKKARNLRKFIMGQFYRLKMYDELQTVFLHACLNGTGWLRVAQDNDKIIVYPVYADNVIFDDHEGKDGKVRQLFQYAHLNKELLCDKFPEHRDAIRNADVIESRQDITGESESLCDMCSIIECWHLPSGPGAKDGRHALCISNETLIDEPYTRPRFPLLKWDYRHSPRSFLGLGAVEELSPIQVEINYISQKIQKLMTLATSQVWTEKGSGVVGIDNKDWAVRQYTGKPPIFQNVQSVSSEYFAREERLKQDAFEIVGVGRLQAQGVKPAGLNSGEALKTYHDIGSARFQDVGQRWENFVCRTVAEGIYDCAADLLERGVDIETISYGDKDVESIKFSDSYMEEDTYVIQAWPTSLLPDSPAGQIESIATLAQAIPQLQPRLAQLLTDIPDLKGVVAELTAPIELADKMISNILDEGIFEQPDLHQDLASLRRQAQLNKARALVEDYPDDRIELLERFIQSIDNLQAQAEQEAQAQMQQQQQMAQAEQAQQGATMGGAPKPKMGGLQGAMPGGMTPMQGPAV